jgi:small subunit ribosomal protein S3
VAFTTYGTIGVKVWIYKGDILVKKEEAVQKREREKEFQAMLKAAKIEEVAPTASETPAPPAKEPKESKESKKEE